MKIPGKLLKALRAMPEPIDPVAELKAVCALVKSVDNLGASLRQGVALAIASRGVMLWKKAGAVK
jgi:hypothetical protein